MVTNSLGERNSSHNLVCPQVRFPNPPDFPKERTPSPVHVLFLPSGGLRMFVVVGMSPKLYYLLKAILAFMLISPPATDAHIRFRLSIGCMLDHPRRLMVEPLFTRNPRGAPRDATCGAPGELVVVELRSVAPPLMGREPACSAMARPTSLLPAPWATNDVWLRDPWQRRAGFPRTRCAHHPLGLFGKTVPPDPNDQTSVVRCAPRRRTANALSGNGSCRCGGFACRCWGRCLCLRGGSETSKLPRTQNTCFAPLTSSPKPGAQGACLFLRVARGVIELSLTLPLFEDPRKRTPSSETNSVSVLSTPVVLGAELSLVPSLSGDLHDSLLWYVLASFLPPLHFQSPPFASKVRALPPRRLHLRRLRIDCLFPLMPPGWAQASCSQPNCTFVAPPQCWNLRGVMNGGMVFRVANVHRGMSPSPIWAACPCETSQGFPGTPSRMNRASPLPRNSNFKRLASSIRSS